jgi:hypothetical protein
MLKELRENILRDVTDQVSPGGSAYLWSDVALVRYINEGERRFARKTECLIDKTTPAVTQITLVAGQDEYPLDDRVITVLSAVLNGNALRKTNHDALVGFPGNISAGNVVVKAQQLGGPLMFTTDEAVRTLRVYPIPDARSAGKTVYLRVSRLPLAELVVSNLKAVPEVPSDHHLDLLEWAAYRALRNHDTDAENMAKASAHKTRFTEALAELGRESKRRSASPVQFGVNARFD